LRSGGTEDSIIIKNPSFTNETTRSLDRLYRESLKRLPLDTDDKYAVFSDLHLGDGGKADKFLHNHETLEYALNYYKEQGYAVILLGDIEELWQFDLPRIRDRYDSTIYAILRSFPPGKLHRVYGNHDKDWAGLRDPISKRKTVFGAPEGILLNDDILLVHGHQGEKMSDQRAWFSRFWIRLFKIIEPTLTKFGYKNYSATESQIPRDRERIYYQWAKANRVFLICGHTHRAIFASRSYYNWLKEQLRLKRPPLRQYSDDIKDRGALITEFLKERNMGRNINALEPDGKDPLPCYFNTGCGLYRHGLTNLEIEKDKIRLVKWRNDRSLALNHRRIKLWRDGHWAEFRKELRSQS